jgi:hypothetical protein
VGVGGAGRVNSQMKMAISVLVDCALDGILRRSLGNGSVRAERNLEVGDVSSANVVDEGIERKEKKGRRNVNQSRPGTMLPPGANLNSPWT